MDPWTHSTPVPAFAHPVHGAEVGPTTPLHAPARVADTTASPSLDSFSERDRDVLEEIAKGSDAQVGFQGIKRRLELHPEALRRVLTRLQRAGVVEKGEYGYALAAKGKQMLAGRLLPAATTHGVPVAGLLLPSFMKPSDLLDRLARRWFDGLHWYGMSEGYGEATLMWLTNAGDAVRLRVGVGRLRLDVAMPEAGLDEALAAAAPLLGAVTDLVRGGGKTAQASEAPVATPTGPHAAPKAARLGAS